MKVEKFIGKWKESGGNERANTQLFVADLCDLLDIDPPHPTRSDISLNDYVFERNVTKIEIDGTPSNGWIDCYKRDCFILEAKQGSVSDAKAFDKGEGGSLTDFFGQTAEQRFKRGMAKRDSGQWVSVMRKAAGQAEGYAKALPKSHSWPPFLLVSDIGYCIDVYADFTKSGRGYVPFPDQRQNRIRLDDLRDAKVRDRLKAIWSNPTSLDPSTEAARVSREIAEHLAMLARRLEKRGHNADGVASFLMRLLFTMFAEDTELLPKKSFSALLQRVRDRPENLVPQLTDLWAKMDSGGFVGALGDAGETVRWFNGYLFKETAAIDLEVEELDVLIKAAKADWRLVEPAIFGTLLERALNPKERARLGAHYTPRTYVERLVEPTIMEPLRQDWLGARTAAMATAEEGNQDAATQILRKFHTQLVRTRVLDPACGTGNFLYVAMARMKELEGEVLKLIEELGDAQYLANLSHHTITPEQFFGIEFNPRAAKVAQLVLWIGYLQWHFRVNGQDRMPDPPVLRDAQNIENRDALLMWDARELERDEKGVPITRWDGETMKKHPLTGKDVPDDSVRLELYRYINPRPAKWPKADFIIGNPPFMGGKDVRERLGSGYFDALFRKSKVPESVDLVMHWWDKAATYLRKGSVRRFGFVTTNSLPQKFSRRVVTRHLESLDSLSLIFAVPDHPWVSEKGNAAVRIAMTVCEKGRQAGTLHRVVDDSGAPSVVHFESRRGFINSDLTVGADVTAASPLKSNKRLASPGVKLHGNGFIVTPLEAYGLGKGVPGVERVIRAYRNGRDLMGRTREAKVIDLYGFSEREVRERFPAIFQHIETRVRPHREHNNRDTYRLNWWVFGEPRSEMRNALHGLSRYIATVETSKHRIFQFLPKEVVADNMIVTIALDDAFHLGVLSSRAHAVWARAAGGTLEDRPRYNKTRCFDPFPFPPSDNEAVRERIGDAAEQLDRLRKDVLERNPALTLTKLYNTLEALRAAEASRGVLTPEERFIGQLGCVSLIRRYHDEIDDAVAESYAWEPALSDDELLEKLVALNKERGREEAQGKVRWLRKDFQAPSYVPTGKHTFDIGERIRKPAQIIKWPGALPEQVVLVAGIVDRARSPILASEVAKKFSGKRTATVVPVLDALAGMGRLRKLHDGRYAA